MRPLVRVEEPSTDVVVAAPALVTSAVPASPAGASLDMASGSSVGGADEPQHSPVTVVHSPSPSPLQSYGETISKLVQLPTNLLQPLLDVANIVLGVSQYEDVIRENESACVAKDSIIAYKDATITELQRKLKVLALSA